MFDHFDDPNPPTLQGAARVRVASHRRRLIRRRRIIVALSASLFAVTGVGIATALANGASVHLRTVAPATPPSVTTSPTGTPATKVTPKTTTPPPTTPPATSTTTSSVAAGTQEITYQPFTAIGIDPSLRVISRVTGTCFAYGGAAGRYYYRCFTDPPSGAIYDPCFMGPRSAAEPLVCPTDPATSAVVELTMHSGGPPDAPPATSTRPWAMQLSNGQICAFVSAAWSGLGPYGCQAPAGARQPVSDCREPRRSRPWWTADCQGQLTAASPFLPTQVSKVWF